MKRARIWVLEPPRFRPGRDYPAYVEPTPEENIRPEYRGSSLPREEFSESGRPRTSGSDGRP